MAKQSLTAQIRNALGGIADSVGKKKNGNVVIRRGFFYRRGMDAHKFAGGVETALRTSGLDFVVVDRGEHWTAFSGGASTANSSHFWVEIAVV